MNIDEKTQLAEKLVKKFIDNFHQTIGTKPIVKYSINGDVPTLNEIFNLVNHYYKKKVVDEDLSICDKDRSNMAVYYRSIYYSIARDFNYSYNEIGELVNKDHATVIYTVNNVQTNNELILKIKQELQN